MIAMDANPQVLGLGSYRSFHPLGPALIPPPIPPPRLLLDSPARDLPACRWPAVEVRVVCGGLVRRNTRRLELWRMKPSPVRRGIPVHTRWLIVTQIPGLRDKLQRSSLPAPLSSPR
jgi:hypothetical protein